MRTPKFWQSKNMISTALLPLTVFYRWGAWLDRHFTQMQHADLPVISIGNVTAGGAGKTPTALALQALLQAQGIHAHFITRGYGRTQRATQPHRVTPQDNWQQVGDEPLLLAKAAPTWVGAKRILSAHAAKQAGADVVIADDALQHYALKKDISLLVLDGQTGLGNACLLPAGPLREPLPTALARCDAVIFIGEDEHGLLSNISQPIFRAHFRASDAAWMTQQPLWAFAGMAYPEKFYRTLRNLGARIAHTQDFTDHHPYSRTEIEALLAQANASGATLVTTTKDAVKIPEDLRAQIRVLEVALQWENERALGQWLEEKLPSRTN